MRRGTEESSMHFSASQRWKNKRRKTMKKMLVTAVAVTLLSAGIVFAEEKGHEHGKMMEGQQMPPEMMEMMKKQGGPKPDNRTELKIPAPMKVMQKGMMRQHMDTVAEITTALAVNDLNKAAEVAKSKLGWNPEEEKRCSMVEKMTGEADFTTFGKAVHQKADELADAAKAGNRDKALTALAELITNCNNCHKKFRH